MTTDRTVADLVVERLVAWDVERIYGYAGDGNNPLLGALRRSEIAPVFGRARHEESAAFAASAEAALTGSSPVVVTGDADEEASAQEQATDAVAGAAVGAQLPAAETAAARALLDDGADGSTSPS